MKKIIKKTYDYIPFILFFGICTSAIAGKTYETKGISISNDLDKTPEATDSNGKTGVDGADQGTAVGATSKALMGSTSIGDSSQSVSKYGVSIGTKANVAENSDEAIAIGKDSKVLKDTKSSVALGAQSVVSQSNTISIGNDSLKRKLINLDRGNVSENSTDAVNGGQLHTANQTMDANTRSIAGLDAAAVKYDKNTDGSVNTGTASLAGKDGTTLTNLKDGKVSRESKDAVNGGQLHTANQTMDANTRSIAGLDAAAVKYDKNTDGSVNTCSVSLRGGSEGTILTNVKDGQIFEGSKDAVTGNQLHQTNKDVSKNRQQIQKNSKKIDELDNKINRIDSRLNKLNNKIDDGLSKAAALNGLFQPYGVGKTNITVAIGGYGDKNAIAVGSGYRFNESVAVKSGIAVSEDNKPMYNVGINIEW